MTLPTMSQDPSKRFEEWWNRVESQIIAIGVSYLRSHSAADDIAQDVAYAAFRQFAQFDEKTGLADFQKWTKQRARWLAIGVLRLRKRETLATDSTLEIEQISQADDTPSDWDADRKVLLAAIERLPRVQRQVTILKLQGHPNKAIAKSLGMKESTVRSVFRHAREYLSREHTVSDLEDRKK